MGRIDNQFITKILKSPRCDWAGLGVTGEMMSLDTRPIFHFIKNHVKDNKGKPPAIRTVKQFFPMFKLKKAPENVEFYGNLILERFAEARLRDLTAKLAENLGSGFDVKAAQEEIAKTSAEISLASSSRVVDSFYGKSAAERLRKFKQLKSGLKADFSLGHPVLDEDLIGAEKGNFFIIAGTPGAGKSWVLLKTLRNLWLDGWDVLLFSYELSKELIERRLDSIAAGVRYSKFRRGLLTEDEIKAYTYKLLEQQKRKNYFQIITTQNSVIPRGGGAGRLDYIYSTIMRRKPQIVAIDGMYLMSGVGDSDWERMASLTRGFHAITQATGVCGWGTTQLNKTSDEKNPKLRDLAYSWAFAQDTDGAFLLSRPDDMRLSGEIAMTAAKFREAEDSLRYIIEFNPGGIIEVGRMDIAIENPLME
jgi:replicative DNA helicase